jgi:hypothetical protein
VDVGVHIAGRIALFEACDKGHTECAQLLINHKADLNAKDRFGNSALHVAAMYGRLSCVKLLVQNGADVNYQTDGFTPLMYSACEGHLTIVHYLLEQKADVHYRVSEEGFSKNQDALYYVMRKFATDRTPSAAFALLSCNTDAKNLSIRGHVTLAIRDAHIEEYVHVQTFIDEHHSILQSVLSDRVQVDARVGRGDNGIYQEPLERTLEYLGLSMSKDQVVNTSIDGEAIKRALIPGHLLNAEVWFDKYHQAQ